MVDELGLGVHDLPARGQVFEVDLGGDPFMGFLGRFQGGLGLPQGALVVLYILLVRVTFISFCPGGGH